MKLEIDRVLVCTTGHLTASDASDLENEATGLVVHETGEYGWMIWADGQEEESYLEKTSSNLRKLIEFAREHECEWIRFDCDADPIDGLPTYDW